MPEQTISELLAPLVKQEVDRQLAEREAAVQADPNRWWNADDIAERYGVAVKWLGHNALNAPRFQRHTKSRHTRNRR